MKRFVKLIIIGVLLAFTLFVAANAWSIYKYSKVDETRETDVAIILGAALTKDGVSPVFRERINMSKNSSLPADTVKEVINQTLTLAKSMPNHKKYHHAIFS